MCKWVFQNPYRLIKTKISYHSVLLWVIFCDSSTISPMLACGCFRSLESVQHLFPYLWRWNPGVNFTKILWAAFAPKFFCQKITNPNCKNIKAAQKLLYEKAAFKSIGEIDTRQANACHPAVAMVKWKHSLATSTFVSANHRYLDIRGQCYKKFTAVSYYFS